jgi:hypothetical protein
MIVLSGCDESKRQVATPESTSTATPSAQESLPAIHGIRVRVPSHCGVLSVVVDGRLWLADPPLGDHNPPDGWGENETSGRFVITGDDQGRFFGDAGQQASFGLAPVGAADPNSGCE